MASQQGQDLFRKEISEQQQQRVLGSISLAQPLSIYLWSSALLAMLALVLSLLLFAEHHRKENVQGYLIPDKGLIRVRSALSGSIAKIHVREGQTVAAGDILVSILRSRNGAKGTELGGLLADRFQQRIALTDKGIDQNRQLLNNKLQSNRSLIESLQSKVLNLAEQARLSTLKLDLQASRFEMQRSLHRGGHLPRALLDQSEEVYLSAQQNAAQLRQQLLSLKQERQFAEAQREQLPMQFSLTTSQLQQARAELDQQLGEVQTSYRSVLRASASGVVTAVQVVQGQSIDPSRSLLTIIPEGSHLIAELLLPTRSIGLVKTGDSARLRFDAFPYQQFGLVAATIIQIDRALLMPDSATPWPLREPVYRVRAVLSQQEIGRADQTYPLRSGMQVQADILLEKRRLLDWVLKPLIGLKVRIG
ncbi:MAG: membrane fusion protein [Patiriisocius sp.]|jgi:membrane fusion protein